MKHSKSCSDSVTTRFLHNSRTVLCIFLPKKVDNYMFPPKKRRMTPPPGFNSNSQPTCRAVAQTAFIDPPPMCQWWTGDAKKKMSAAEDAKRFASASADVAAAAKYGNLEWQDMAR